MAIDLTQLPPPTVVEDVSFEDLLALRKARLLALVRPDDRASVSAALALETEPLTILLQESCYNEMILRQRINDAAKAVLLAHAQGADLDNTAANVGTSRLTIRAADPTATPPIEQVLEDDDSLRLRASMAFEGLSVAGPREAYRFHAQSADGRVADVDAYSPAPCEAVISILSRDGDGTATQDLIDIVARALNDEDIRPVGDRVQVRSAGIVPYQVIATLHLYPGPESEPIRTAAEASLKSYISKTRRIGRDINLSALYAALHVEGVQRVELTEPRADIKLQHDQAGYCTAYAITVGSSDD
ncbi:baseplate assembly protein [Paludibacterium paludis]|uniref:Baseplate assembly protein n=1 Tax=Paludibacterium paludis TaxID=1225769 RepID=A0A918U7B3_9NEIS|nr:baseplate J/gp47 family protein [Paludibacterium paludis]GGY03776.1 baseplate assembly protein [Paludibacterium paludis]